MCTCLGIESPTELVAYSLPDSGTQRQAHERSPPPRFFPSKNLRCLYSTRQTLSCEIESAVAALAGAEGDLNSKSFYLWRQKVRHQRDRFVPGVVTDRGELELERGVRLKVGKQDLKAVRAPLQ